MSSAESLQRRRRTKESLGWYGIHLPSGIPHVEREIETYRRTTKEVVFRAAGLCLVAHRASGLAEEIVESTLAVTPIECHLTRLESRFLRDQHPSKREIIRFSWRIECAWVLVWSLQFFPQLGLPSSICNPKEVMAVFQSNGLDGMTSRSILREQSEILDALDLTFCATWIVRDADLRGRPVPEQLNGDVAEERYHALSWLTNFVPWDETPTDT